MKSLLLVLFLSAAHVAFSNPDTTYALPTVVVTATRTPQEIANTNRSIDVISTSATMIVPSASVSDVLRSNALIDIQSRGIDGVQSDASLRGAYFEQVLFLLDGIPMSDPQTGHHNLDLPIPASGIGRIEVVPGAGSSLYGPDAFGGVVNVIPRDGASPMTLASLSMGEHNSQRTDITVARPITQNVSGLFAGSWKRSDGFHYDTDFQVGEAFGQVRWAYDTNRAIVATVAYSNKTFGAYDFYSGPGKDVPSSEATTSTLLAISAPMTIGDFSFTPKIYTRAHTDRYVYLITNPSLYINNHKDFTDGAEITGATHFWGNSVLLFGAEATNDHLTSVGEGTIPSGLGTHERTRGAVFASVTHTHETFSFDLGMRVDAYSTFAPQFSPAISAGYIVSPNIRVFASAGHSFRAPSFTELFYSDPDNVGGANLKPEAAWSEELGMRITAGTNWKFGAAVFMRQETNTIDFAQDSAGDPVTHAVNIPSANVRGVEATIDGEFDGTHSGGLRSLRAGWTVLDATNDLSAKAVPRYTLLRPKQQLTANITYALMTNWLKLDLGAVYKVRQTGDGYTLVNARLSHSFPLESTSALTLSVEGTNLTNIIYEELPGVPTPRRWMFVTATVEM